MNYKAIIVDDEKKSCQVLQYWLEKTNAFEISGSFTDPVEAFESLGKTLPEIVFLDVDMPVLNGIKFAEKALQLYPGIRIVMTTAHEQYAIQALNTGVFGYLLKPYDFEAICDLIGRLLKGQKNQPVSSVMTFSTKDKDYYFRTEDILYLNAVGNYTEIHTMQPEPIMLSKTLKHFSDILPESFFIRLSRALIVNNLYLQWIDKKKQTAMLKLPSGETITLHILSLRKVSIE